MIAALWRWVTRWFRVDWRPPFEKPPTVDRGGMGWPEED